MDVVVIAQLQSREVEYWESPPTETDWRGAQVVTRMELAVVDELCGDTSSTLWAYHRDGEMPGHHQVSSDTPEFLEDGALYGFILRPAGDLYTLVWGRHDVLHLDDAGLSFILDDEVVLFDAVAEACP